MRTYEALIIFADTVKEDHVNDALSSFQAEVERQGGTVQDRIALGRRSFARPLKKRDSGQYGKVCFSLAPEHVAALKQRCKFVADLFRVQIVLQPKVRAPAAETDEAAPVADEAVATVAAREE